MQAIEPCLDAGDVVFGRPDPASGRDKVGAEARLILLETVDLRPQSLLPALRHGNRPFDRLELGFAGALPLLRGPIAKAKVANRLGFGRLGRERNPGRMRKHPEGKDEGCRGEESTGHRRPYGQETINIMPDGRGARKVWWWPDKA